MAWRVRWAAAAVWWVIADGTTWWLPTAAVVPLVMVRPMQNVSTELTVQKWDLVRSGGVQRREK